MQIEPTTAHRYLYVESIPATRPRHRQLEDAPPKYIPFQFDAISVCPCLALLVVANVSQRPHQLQLTLFRPISLTTLLIQVCNPWRSTIATDIVSLFGRDFYSSELGPSMSLDHRPASKVVTDLIIKPGAYISQPTDTGDTTPCRPVQDRMCPHRRIRIEDETWTIGLKDTMAIVFGNASDAGESDLNAYKHRPSILLECTSSMLELVTEAVSPLSEMSYLILMIRRQRSMIAKLRPSSTVCSCYATLAFHTQ